MSKSIKWRGATLCGGDGDDYAEYAVIRQSYGRMVIGSLPAGEPAEFNGDGEAKLEWGTYSPAMRRELKHAARRGDLERFPDGGVDTNP